MGNPAKGVLQDFLQVVDMLSECEVHFGLPFLVQRYLRGIQKNLVPETRSTAILNGKFA